MTYITPKNTRFLNQHVIDTNILIDMIERHQPEGDLKQSLITKLKNNIAGLKSLVAETVLADGSTKIMHPSIYQVQIKQERAENPERLFCSRVRSIYPYTITVSQADAIISPEGVVSYTPTHERMVFQMSEPAFSSLISGDGESGGTLRKLDGVDAPELLEDAMLTGMRSVSSSQESEYDDRMNSLKQAIALFSKAQEKGGKLSAKDKNEITKKISSSGQMAGNLGFFIKRVGEMTESVASEQRVEIEAVIRFNKKGQEKN